MPQKKRVKKIITHSFDKFVQSDYSGATDDNLNPKRNMEYETQVEDLTKAVADKLDVIKGHIRSRIESQDFSTEASLSEGGDSGIDDLVNSLVTGGNGTGHKYPGIEGPTWLEQEIDQLLAYTIASGSPQLQDIFDSFDLKYINCYGVDTIDGGYDYSESDSSDDDSSTSNDGSSIDNNGNSTDSNSSADGDDSSSNDDGGPPWDISYTVSNGANSSANPTSYTADFLPLYIEEPSADGGYKFKGWFYDSSFATKVVSNVITSGHTGPLSLYAKMTEISDEDDDSDDEWEDASEDDDDFDDDDYEKACDIADLLILKIVAIIIQIIAALIKVISLVLAILIPLAEILQLATICWIDPPAIGKIINNLMQTAFSMIMQIIGKLLQKLWSMLGLECISDSMMSLIDQVNEALSGISGIMLSISDAAADLGSAFDLAKTIREAVISAVDSVKDQLEDLSVSKILKDAASSAASGAKEGWGSIVDQVKDPDTYLDLAPEEAKETVESLVNSVKTTQKLARSLQKTAATMTGAFKGLSGSASKAVASFKVKD